MAVLALAGAFLLAAAASVTPGPWKAAAAHLDWLVPALAGALLLATLSWGRELLRQEAARRHAVEMQLAAQQRAHRAVLDGMPHAIAVRDPQARLVYCNPACLKLLGLPLHKVVAKSLPESLAGSANAELGRVVHERYLKLLADGVAVTGDLDLAASGRVRRLMHWASPIAGRHDGQPAGLVCGVIDITERHQLAQMVETARAKAEALSRAKSGFLSTMSHEIRTPMNAVLGGLELLLREGRLAPVDQESVELALGAAQALLGLIDDALDFSKVEAGAMDLVARPTQVALLVREAAEIHRGRASQRGLDLRIETEAAPAGWHGADALRLRQVVNNLVANAIRFTDSGEVVVRLSGVGTADGVESMLLEVRDTGIGMGPDELRKLFQPFFQAESAGARTQGGTGLGLAIAQGLCARMGGEIEVQSTPGTGTTIRARLPLPVVAAPEAGGDPDEAPVQGVPSPARGRFTVLVADDHPANRLLMRRQLEFLGYRAALAEDGRQALERWQAGDIDAVIADCSMPVMDGYTLASEIRAIERREGKDGRRCPVLGCTAHVREQDRQRALDAGMDECLAKPLGLDELLQALQRHLHDPSGAGRLPPAREEAPCDTSAFAVVSAGDPEVERQFLAALLEANIGDLETLAGLVRAGGQGQDIATLAHRIKGPARLVRARQVVRDCERLEAAATAGRPEALARALAALESSLGRFNDLILKRLQMGSALAH